MSPLFFHQKKFDKLEEEEISRGEISNNSIKRKV